MQVNSCYEMSHNPISSQICKKYQNHNNYESTILTFFFFFLTYQVFLVCFLKLHVFDAIFTDPQFRLFPILFRKWWKIPRIYLVFAKLDFIHKLNLGNLKWRKQWTGKGEKGNLLSKPNSNNLYPSWSLIFNNG